MAAIILFAILTAVVIVHNFYRLKIKPRFELEPNCLITSSPVIFLSGKPSFFYFLNYWNHIPYIFREHGYEVYESPYIPSLDSAVGKVFFDSLLNSGKNYHLIADESQTTLIKSLESEQFSFVNSLTIIKAPQAKGPVNAQDLYPAESSINYIEAENNDKKKLASPIGHLVYWLHRSYTKSPHGWSPEIVGVDLCPKDSKYFGRLLRHLILLAESDLKCSH